MNSQDTSGCACESRHPKKRDCPGHGGECSQVSLRTILHHILDPWAWTPSAARYFHCDSLDCEVAYFGADDSVILKSRLRSRLPMTELESRDLLCHCFGATLRDIERNPAIRDFIVAQTKAGDCSCETSSPSGACCLGRLSKIVGRTSPEPDTGPV